MNCWPRAWQSSYKFLAFITLIYIIFMLTLQTVGELRRNQACCSLPWPQCSLMCAILLTVRNLKMYKLTLFRSHTTIFKWCIVQCFLRQGLTAGYFQTCDPPASGSWELRLQECTTTACSDVDMKVLTLTVGLAEKFADDTQPVSACSLLYSVVIYISSITRFCHHEVNYSTPPSPLWQTETLSNCQSKEKVPPLTRSANSKVKVTTTQGHTTVYSELTSPEQRLPRPPDQC